MKKIAEALVIKRAKQLLQEKKAFVPMPGGQMPPQGGDPAMAGGMPPMDPAQMGAYAAPPMDPAMLDPAMAGGMPPMDPAMMDPAMMGGDPAAMGGEMPEPLVAELPVSEFQALIADTVAQVLGGGGGGEGEDEEIVPTGEEGGSGPTNTELLERIGALEEMLAGLLGGGAPAEAGMPMGPEGGMMAPDPAMMGAVPGMEVAAGAKPRPGLADRLVNSVLDLGGKGI